MQLLDDKNAKKCVFLVKTAIFFLNYLVMSEKCSNFARFFAVRAYIRTCVRESMEQNNKQKLTNQNKLKCLQFNN